MVVKLDCPSTFDWKAGQFDFKRKIKKLHYNLVKLVFLVDFVLTIKVMKFMQKRDILCPKQDRGLWSKKRDCPAQKFEIRQTIVSAINSYFSKKITVIFNIKICALFKYNSYYLFSYALFVIFAWSLREYKTIPKYEIGMSHNQVTTQWGT